MKNVKDESKIPWEPISYYRGGGGGGMPILYFAKFP